MTPTTSAGTIRQLWPLLYVDDVNRSIDFYQNKLGFAVVGQAESDGQVFWCRLERGGASLMLQLADQTEDGPSNERGRGVALYFVCDDADLVRAEFAARGLDLAPVSVAEYGMKQLFVPEPNGYSICFESPTDTWAG